MNDHREERPGGALPARPEMHAAPAPADACEKKPFVEPSVSVPADVLEATALFQAPTVQTSIVP